MNQYKPLSLLSLMVLVACGTSSSTSQTNDIASNLVADCQLDTPVDFGSQKIPLQFSDVVVSSEMPARSNGDTTTPPTPMSLSVFYVQVESTPTSFIGARIDRDAPDTEVGLSNDYVGNVNLQGTNNTQNGVTANITTNADTLDGAKTTNQSVVSISGSKITSVAFIYPSYTYTTDDSGNQIKKFAGNKTVCVKSMNLKP